MAQQSIESTDVINDGRTKINANFTELYNGSGLGGSLATSNAILPASGSYSTFQAKRLLSTTPVTGSVEFGDLGNITGGTEKIIENHVFIGGIAGRGVMMRNMKWSVSAGKYITIDQTSTAYGSCLFEAGGEGASIHASPAGADFGDHQTMGFLVTANGPRSVTGVTSAKYCQTLNTLFASYESSPSALPKWNSGNTPLLYLHSGEAKGTSGTDTYNELARLQVNSNTGTAYPSFNFHTSSGAIASPANVSSGRITGELSAQAYGGAYRKTASIRFVVSGTVSGSGAGQSITFLTSATTVTNLTERMRITEAGSLSLERTVTTAGTTGNQTINKMAGTVNFAAAATSITVTNSLVTASSIVIATVRTNDSTAVIKNVVPGSGSFVITLEAAATAETSVGFLVLN